MSETPSTDEVALSARSRFGVYPGLDQYVPADFARDQEREIASLQQKLTAAEQLAVRQGNEIRRLRAGERA